MAHRLADPQQRPIDAYQIAMNPFKYINKTKVYEYFGSERVGKFAMKALHYYLERGHGKVPGRVIIDTIHAAKGREGDVVFVVDSVSSRILGEVYTDQQAFENEVRVWYVAMTRARESLVLVPTDNPFLKPLLIKALKSKIPQKMKVKKS